MTEEEDDGGWSVGDRLVNRQVLFVVAQQAYTDWANRNAETVSFRPDRTGTAYLIPAFDDDDETEQYVRANFDMFFVEELSAWDYREETWPAARTFEMFATWFDVRVAPLVFDAGTDPLGVMV